MERAVRERGEGHRAGDAQIAQHRLDDALEIEEVQQANGGVSPPLRDSARPGEGDPQAARLVGQRVVGARQVDRPDLEQKLAVGVTGVGGDRIEQAGQQGVAQHRLVGGDGIGQGHIGHVWPA